MSYVAYNMITDQFIAYTHMGESGTNEYYLTEDLYMADKQRYESEPWDIIGEMGLRHQVGWIAVSYDTMTAVRDRNTATEVELRDVFSRLLNLSGKDANKFIEQIPIASWNGLLKEAMYYIKRLMGDKRIVQYLYENGVAKIPKRRRVLRTNFDKMVRDLNKAGEAQQPNKKARTSARVKRPSE